MARRARPILAALLALVLAGLGHAYLREWRRAAGWFGAIMLVGVGLSAVFADAGVTSVADLPREVLLPVVALFLASAVDAYRLADAESGAQSAETVERARESGEELTCANCGRDVDPTMEFCQWCAEPLPGTEEPDPDRGIGE